MIRISDRKQQVASCYGLQVLAYDRLRVACIDGLLVDGALCTEAGDHGLLG